MSTPKDSKKISFHFSSDIIRVKEASRAVIDEISDFNFDESSRHDIRLCVEEAFINAVKYGNKSDPCLTVDIMLLKESGQVEIIISDYGDGFNYWERKDPTLDENLAKAGGRGLFLIKKLMDQVFFKDEGRSIHMIKKTKVL